MLVAYVFNQDFGANSEGDVVQLDPETAQALVDAGVISEASEEHVNGGDEGEEATPEAPEQNAALTRAVASLSKNLEKTIAKTTEQVVSRVVNTARPTGLGTVPAQTKAPVFKCMGEMLKAQWQASQGNVRARNQLNAYEQELRLKAPPLGSNEGTNTQGGYAVKPEWYREIWDKVRDYPNLLDMTEVININSNTLNIPALSETSLVDGTRHGGVLAYWLAEAATATSSYPALTQVQSVLNTQVVLVYVTNQLLQDANIENFESFINKKVALEFAWQHNQAVISGSGSSQPTGILNQPSLVTVTKSGNDTNAMFGFRDLANMYRALYPPSRNNAVFIMNPEAYAILLSMVFEPSTGSATTYPAFGGLSYNAADERSPLRIFGRPVIECMNNPQLGLPGDIILADLSQLVCAQHPGIEAAISTEIQFPTLQTAYRFVRRYDLKSPWTAALTPADGKTQYNYSPFVVLQSRGT